MYERTEEDYSKWKKAQSKSDYSDDDDEETNVKQKKEKEKEKNDKSERNKKDYIDSTSDDGKETIRFSLIQNNPERINQKICPECGLIIIESLEQQHEDGHMVEILPHLYLGDFKNAANKHELQKKEIKCIVNVTKELSCKFPDEMEYTKIEWDDDDSVNIKPDLERTSQWIHERLEQKRNVLVHCQMGCSRSPTVVIGYLMLKKGYSFKDALNHVELKKPDISPRRSFREQLQDLLKPEFVASVQKWKPKRQQQQASVPTEEIKKEHESKDQQPSRTCRLLFIYICCPFLF